MLLLLPDQAASLRPWFLPDQPGPLVGLHILNTGHGACFVDRWPDPRAVLVTSGGNYTLIGDPDVLPPSAVQGLIAGFVDSTDAWIPMLTVTFPNMQVWERIMFVLPTQHRVFRSHNAIVRRLDPVDTYQIWGLSPDVAWIAKTWGGPAGLAASGMAWGAFVDDRLVAVACTFFVGDHYEELGVVTEPAFREMGLSVACAGALCEDIQGRGRQPSWTTSPDNHASVRVAEKLGFAFHHHDRLYAIGISIPPPAHKSAHEST